jgi:hypothetical protein
MSETMFPRKYEPLLFALLLSGQMSLLVSGISTWRAAGLAPGFVVLWLSGWLAAWAIAFPIAAVVAPVTRRLVRGLLAAQ